MIVIGKVDCDADGKIYFEGFSYRNLVLGSISTKYHVNKYPTLKLYRHGLMTKREYRGARFGFCFDKLNLEEFSLFRQIDALSDFLRKQVESSIVKLSIPNDLGILDPKKSFLIGHFDDEKSVNYQTFSKVANLLREECHFAASTNK